MHNCTNSSHEFNSNGWSKCYQGNCSWFVALLERDRENRLNTRQALLQYYICQSKHLQGMPVLPTSN